MNVKARGLLSNRIEKKVKYANFEKEVVVDLN